MAERGLLGGSLGGEGVHVRHDHTFPCLSHETRVGGSLDAPSALPVLLQQEQKAVRAGSCPVELSTIPAPDTLRVYLLSFGGA